MSEGAIMEDRQTLDLSGASFSMDSSRFTNLEHGVIVAHSGDEYMVESLTRPGHRLLLKMAHECESHLQGQEIAITFSYPRCERNEFCPSWAMAEQTEIVFYAHGSFKPFVEAYQMEFHLSCVRDVVMYRALRDGETLYESSDRASFCRKVDEMTEVKGPMAVLAALQSPVTYELRRYGEDWIPCKRVPDED